MEELGQVTIYDLLGKAQSTFTVGDKVRVTITPDSDYEAYIYLEAYFAIALKKRGEVVEVLPNNQYKISFAGELQILRAHEIAI